jgi:High potential iron-sulfur protein
MSESSSMSRRDALKGFVLLCGAAGALGSTRQAQAADLPHLSPEDPTAKALGYHEDAKTVEKKKFATYVAGQSCSTCLQFQGKPGDAYAGCNIFAGKAVNANGWCQVWVKKG